MNYLTRIGACLLVASLAACGGGGGSAGSTPFGSGSSSSSGSGSGSGSSSTGSSTSTGTGTSGAVSNTLGTIVLALSSSGISSSSPGTVTAQVKDSSGNPVAQTVVTFAVSSTIATVTPATVLTDASGFAAATIAPSNSSANGAAYVSGTADTSAGTLTQRLPFSVSPVNVTLNTLTSSVSSIAAYGSLVLTAAVSGASASSPVSVSFTSTCATASKAVISPATLSLSSGSGTVTYQDNGCATTDRVTATVTGTGQSRAVDIVVQAPQSRSIEFVSATPTSICLSGSGCSASSIVSFRVKDQNGVGVASQAVTFALDIPNVATLTSTTGTTDAQGLATVSVQSGTVPTPVRVTATVSGASGSLSTVSNALAINSGLPTQNAVSFSAATYNVDGLERDGTNSLIRIQLNDRFGNPVPDGTSVSFVSEGASVIPARCTTSSAVCTVSFVSSNARPTDGRVTVVAYAQGEESFSDQNGDNKYNTGEPFTDLGPVYVDKNENGTMDIGEFIAGSAADGVWSSNNYVRASQVFTLSSSARAPRLFDPDVNGSCTVPGAPSFTPPTFTLTAGGTCRVTKSVCLRDGNTGADAGGGNPIPAGAVLTASTKAKDATVSIDGTPMTSTPAGVRPTLHHITAELTDCTKADTPGSVDITVQMPNAGPSYTLQNIGQVN